MLGAMLPPEGYVIRLFVVPPGEGRACEGCEQPDPLGYWCCQTSGAVICHACRRQLQTIAGAFGASVIRVPSPDEL